MLRQFNLTSFVVFRVAFLGSILWAELVCAGVGVKPMPRLIMPVSNESSDTNFSEKILPKSLTAADSSQSVVAKIIDNSLTYWWDNSELKNTSIGRAATKIENNLKAEVDLGTFGDAQIEHKISLKLLAMQTLAKIEYKGWIKAALNYDIKASKAEAEVIENLSNNKDLVISHSVTVNENKSQLSLRWKW